MIRGGNTRRDNIIQGGGGSIERWLEGSDIKGVIKGGNNSEGG